MPLSLHTNVASPSSQRRLLLSSAVLKDAGVRLGNGVRIASARDDAAGLALSAATVSHLSSVAAPPTGSSPAVSFEGGLRSGTLRDTDVLSAARSRLADTDFALESANLSRAQVLQQAATAMLSQSNARPQQVLSLLR
jgi:flagellin-like hook-associated protein FlgL